MKRVFRFLIIVVGMFNLNVQGQQQIQPDNLALKVDKSKQARIIITTDLEADDMNGLILSLMYSDQYDLAGIVWTSGMYHFNGDNGQHTLGEITPNYRCNAQHCEHRVESAADLTEYRPVDPTWLDRIVDYYEIDYQMMSKNNPNFPTPEYIRSISKVGNIEFEGDYRFETEGSKLIMDLIMDDDMRPLHIQHWGGINTTVRALYSIYEKYHGTPEWETVLAKVISKVRFMGSGEDNCRADSNIDEMFPGLQDLGYGTGFFSYGSFFAASYNSDRRANEKLQPYLHADFILDAYKKGHGKLPEEIWLMGEGRAIYGEPIIYNYGLITYMDWAKSAELGWGPESLKDFKRVDFKPYDWSICQFGCASYIDIGLRSDVTHRTSQYIFRENAQSQDTSVGDHYTIIMWEELAARADWAIKEPEDCNHAPIVNKDNLELSAKPGRTVEISGKAVDPDGDNLTAKWWIPAISCTYKDGKGKGLAVSSENGWKTQFVVPNDAKKGDVFVINLEVKDDASRPMTRFAQYIITVG